MDRKTLRRLLLMVPTQPGIMVFTFMLIQFMPGGPIERILRTLVRGLVTMAQWAGRRSTVAIDAFITGVATALGVAAAASASDWNRIASLVRMIAELLASVS